MLIRKFQIPPKIWEDKRIPKETKYIYSYIYAKGFDRIITDINIGEIQQTIKIKNKGLKKSWIVNTFLDNFYKDSCKRYWAGVW